MLFKLVLPEFWCKKNIISYLLLPFACIYRLVVFLRRSYYLLIKPKKLPVPIVVVGNIVVGGSGKTPFVIYLAELLKKQGYHPGIISRGYGGKSQSYPIIVNFESDPAIVGDEAIVLFKRTKCPIAISPKRVIAVQKLLSDTTVDIIISDDGLQHYALSRDIEIAIVDNEFKHGNGFCLPAGPLREPVSRLQEVDFVINNYCNGELNVDGMVLKPVAFYNLKDPRIVKSITDFKGKRAHAFAGIGSPFRFFQTLRLLGMQVIEHPLPDHHVFKDSDFCFQDSEIIVLTEKDAVKCNSLINSDFWCLQITAFLDDKFSKEILAKIQKIVII